MIFEYDPEKSESNKRKHGISFDEAKDLWLVPALEAEANCVNEPRFLKIGKINGKFYTCVFAVRGEVVRLISARRSRKNEERAYEEKTNE